MINSLYTSETGVLACQTAIDVLGYNIANINTDAFKKNDVTFQEILQQTYNVAKTNINPMQKGLGAQYSDIRTIMTQGQLNKTSSKLDMGIDGNGFFILNKKGTTLYSRLGHFGFDAGENSTSDGYPLIDENGKIYYLGDPTLTKPMNLVNLTDGAYVQGWNADTTTGEINTNNAVTDIVINDYFYNLPPEASTYVDINGSIDSSAAFSSLNSTTAKNLILGNDEIDAENISNYFTLKGSSTNNVQGTYELLITNKDILDNSNNVTGSYPQVQVTFTNASNNEKTVNTFYDSTIDLSKADSQGNIVLTNIIPGTELTINTNDLFENGKLKQSVKLELDNTGKSEGDEFSAINTVYDADGQEHNVRTTFRRISENTWYWKTDLINVEEFNGRGNAQSLVLSNNIDPDKDITVSIISTTTGGQEVTRQLDRDEYYIFEGNKIITNTTFNSTDKVQISYSDMQGTSHSEVLEDMLSRQILVLDKNIDPESVEIFVDNDTNKLISSNYSVVGNKIMPVDSNGDGKADVPFIYPGIDLTVKYNLSPVSKEITSNCKDEFIIKDNEIPDKIKFIDEDGDGKADFLSPNYSFIDTNNDGNSDQVVSNHNKYNDLKIELSTQPDLESIKLSVLNTETNETREISLPANLEWKDNILTVIDNRIDSNGNGYTDTIADLLNLQTNEKLIVNYTPVRQNDPINLVKNYTIVDQIPEDSQNVENPILPSTGIKLDGIPSPDLQALSIKVNGIALSESEYEIAGDMIYRINSKGNPIVFGNNNDTIEVTYKLAEPTEGILTFDDNGNVIGGNRDANITFDIASASSPLTLKYNFEDIIQQDGTPNTLDSYSDGYAKGILEKFETMNDGRIVGSYTNGVERNIAQVALATFTNPQGLERYGDSYFQINDNSIEPKISVAGYDGTAGAIKGQRIEASNVDLSTELANLINLQRSFQLNAKGITTSDEMIQVATNLIR